MTSPSTPVCYFPRGNIAPHHTPCNASAAESWCCNSNDFCLSNGHCLQASESFPNRIGRGSCTDRQWNSAACPFECADVRTDQDFALFLAYEPQNGASPFCCDGPYDNVTETCAKPSLGSSKPFQLPLGRIVYNRTDGAVMMNGTLPADSSQHGTCEAQTAVSQNQTSIPTTCPSEAAQVSKSGSTNMTAIASGIAVPLGVLLLASLVAVVVLLRQNRSLRKSLRQGPKVETLPASQMSSPSYGRAEEAKGQGQTVYSYSPLNEMSDGRNPIESGGRAVAQELPARFHG